MTESDPRDKWSTFHFALSNPTGLDQGTAVSLPMMGVIEVHEGVITAWRDYFDLSQFTLQIEKKA
jgi:hypothetical protein